jgi:hypothetical protein
MTKLNRETDDLNYRLNLVRRKHEEAVFRHKQFMHMIHRLQRINLFHEKTAVKLLAMRDD